MADVNGFLNRLQRGLKSCRLNGCNVLLAVSGGADSVALLRGTVACRNAMNLRLVAAHFNHRLRGERSNEDAEWVEKLCEHWEIPICLGSHDVSALANSAGLGIEEAARKTRYRFLEQTAKEQDCSHIVVAHTANDQTETILHHLLRGTGLLGLSGMPSTRQLRSGIVSARPLLEIERHEVESYLKELSQDFRIDTSNVDESFTRNRIRRSLLPTLRDEYNPQVDRVLRNLGVQAREIQTSLEFIAGNLLKQAILDQNETTCRLSCDALAGQPAHLIREVFVLLWRQLDWPRQQMGFAEWDRLKELVSEQQDTATSLPGGIEARRRGNLLVLRR